jgi:hypothetical protein
LEIAAGMGWPHAMRPQPGMAGQLGDGGWGMGMVLPVRRKRKLLDIGAFLLARSRIMARHGASTVLS